MVAVVALQEFNILEISLVYPKILRTGLAMNFHTIKIAAQTTMRADNLSYHKIKPLSIGYFLFHDIADDSPNTEPPCNRSQSKYKQAVGGREVW